MQPISRFKLLRGFVLPNGVVFVPWIITTNTDPIVISEPSRELLNRYRQEVNPNYYRAIMLNLGNRIIER